MKTDAFKKRITFFSSLLFAFSLVLSQTACSNLLPKEEDALAVPLVTPAAVEYKTQAAALSSISNEISMSGKVIAAQQKDLFFTCDKGRLKDIFVTSGDKVKAGDVLAAIETDDLDNKISLQKLEVEKAQIQYDSADESSNTENSTSKNTEKSLALINLKEQKIQLEALNAQKSGSTILAPFDGEITYTCKNNLGDVIDGYTTIVTICDPTTLIVGTNDQLAASFSVGADATIVLRDNSQTDATVIETPSTIDSKSEYAAYSFLSFKGEIPAAIKYGTNVIIKYVTEQKDSAIVVPKKYVVSSNNRKYVVVLEDGLRVEKDVTVGITSDTDAEIVSGLEAGDLIILN